MKKLFTAIMFPLLLTAGLSGCDETYSCEDDCHDRMEDCLDGCSSDDCEESCKDKHRSCVLGCDAEGW